MKLSEWIEKNLFLFFNGTLTKAEAKVAEGKIKIYFHEWELRIDLTPNESIIDQITKH
jgi:hypothetical protein